MSASPTPPASYRFDQVELFPIERRLCIDGRDVTLGARAFDLLLALVERRDRLVTRDELLDLVWPETSVEPNNLAVQIGALRKVLGPHVVATIPGRGYRFSVPVDELRDGPPAGAAPAVRRTNLPDASLPLFGRHDELREIAGLLDAHRLVSVVGPGGIGKSRLAQRLLQERRDAYPHGVCWIELAAVSDPASLPAAIAAGLGVALPGDASSDRLEAALAPLEILVGLDNAEHLLHDLATLADNLLGCAPGLTLLVTSQAPLRLPEEATFRLGALAVPGAPVTARSALLYGAVELFVRRARSVDARFRLDDGNAPAVARICERLDGLPLAIEFAAARAPHLGVERVLESLDQRFDLLKGGPASATPRQRTMRATLEWSHQLLGRDEQILFRRLAVIAGSASLELVQAIAADTDESTIEAAESLDRWATIDALDALIDRSLVATVADPADAARPRYRLLETLRAYAAERLAAAGEVALMDERHAYAVAATMGGVRLDRWSGRIAFGTWIDRVEADRDNARVALAWALRHGAFPVLLQIAAVLLTRHLPGADFDERTALAEALDRALAGRPVEPAQLPARAELMRFWNDRDVQRGLREAERVFPLAEACGDRFMMYFIQACLVRMHVQTRDRAAAVAALARVEALEDPAWPAARLWVGAETRALHEYVHGTPAAYRDAVRREHLVTRLAGATGTGCSNHLINAELAAGDFAAAAALGWAFLDELRGSRDARNLQVLRVNLTAALIGQGDLEGATAMAREAWKTARFSGIHGECADYLALLAALDERWADAVALMGYADAVYARRGTQRWPVEKAVYDRVTRLAETALGAPELERRRDDGQRLADVEVAAVAFGSP